MDREYIEGVLRDALTVLGERLNEALFAIREADHREGRAPVDATTRIEASIEQEVFWDADFSAYAGEEEDYSHNVSDRDE